MTRQDPNDPFAAFAGRKYLSLETYRRNGQAIRTPLWFAAAPDEPALFLYTLADSAKVKRLRHTPAARIAPCDMRGGVDGPWIDVQAAFVSGPEYERGMRLLDRKYWPLKPLMNLISALRPAHQRVVIVLRGRTTSPAAA